MIVFKIINFYLIMKDELQEAKIAAFKLLARKSVFTKELEYKLKEKGFSFEIISEVVALCRRMGALDDEQLRERVFAKELAKGKGSLWTAAKYRKWLGETTGFKPDPEKEKEAILKLLAKKKIDLDKLDILGKKKIGQYLMQRGFTTELIFEILR